MNTWPLVYFLPHCQINEDHLSHPREKAVRDDFAAGFLEVPLFNETKSDDVKKRFAFPFGASTVRKEEKKYKT